MAKAVFNSLNGLVAIAADQTALDNLVVDIVRSKYNVVDLEDIVFNNVRLNKSWISYDGTNIIEHRRLEPNEVTDGEYIPFKVPVDQGIPVVYNAFQLEQLINNAKYELKHYLKGTTNSIALNYLNALEAIDISTITFPMYQSLEEYMESQGNTVVHALQLK
jgi:hypothetical protein